LIHPELEEPNVFWRPRLVTRHAPVNQAGVDLRSPSFDVFVWGEIEPISLHGVHVGTVAKQRSNVGCKTYGHEKTHSAGNRVTLKCRVALLTSLYFAGLKAWEAIKTIHLGIAGIFQVGQVDYTTPKRNPEAD